MSLTAEQTSALSKLALANAPVAMAFVSTLPEGVNRIGKALPASCSYWKQAAAGRTFATAADDHTSCLVGAYTHGVALSREQAIELQTVIGMMTELKYIKKEEIPVIPHRSQPMRFAVYSPLAGATFDPDAIIFRGNPRQIMLLTEAARAASVFDAASVMGRPACAMVPQAMSTQAGVARCRLHRQSRVHGTRRQRAVLDRARSSCGPPARLSGDCSRNECRARAVSPEPSGGVG